MNLQQFQADEPLRVQRMTADEAASVIALWQRERAEHTGLTNKPSVPDVAEGLNITVEDVQRLLNDVRAQRLEEERALTQEQELATAEMRLADEEARLADIQQRRAHIHQETITSGPVPWEVWKAAQAALPEVEAEADSWKVTRPDLLETDNVESEYESAVLAKVWTWIIVIFLGLLICFKWIMP